jgi:thiosulfate/3-mercaptopyruvate sulfurtransferase
MMTTLLLAVHLAAAEPPRLLVEVTDPKLKEYRLLDARGKANYEDGHIPGAVAVELGQWSSAVTKGKADAAYWKAELAKVGVTPTQPVVAYSDDLRDAARVWWMLKMAGVPDARVLNGGWKAYTAAKLPEQKEAVTATAPPHDWTPDPERFADKAKVLELIKSPDAVAVVDARTKEEHTGEQKGAKKVGHIPGSVHLEWVEFFDRATGKFHPPADLKKLAADRKIDLGKPAVTYCQGGGRAAVAALGLELMGVKKVRNYYASWASGVTPTTPRWRCRRSDPGKRNHRGPSPVACRGRASASDAGHFFSGRMLGTSLRISSILASVSSPFLKA